ncbi:unnamed protein product [Adineta steineri]|uniref:PDZ domain-containing protein n=1 Tax=Adineta steineri TaxID=433720 RepID=A0A813RR65_9BILA|nr:unnamed protein product [Adineta steineri]CAF3555561.1 unnamed protein product [Adineta steineri]
MIARFAVPHQISIPSDNDDNNSKRSSSPPSPSSSKLLLEQSETHYITIPEAIELVFHSFIPQADITSQVHFVSNIQSDSQADLAGLKDGDRILQVNGINVTSLEHEEVRKLMQLMTPIVLTVRSDPKYLLLLQQSVTNIEEKLPEPLIALDEENSYDPKNRKPSRFELKRNLSIDSTISNSRKLRRCEIFHLIQPNERSNKEPLEAKLCRLRESKSSEGYGLVLIYRQNLHIINEVEKTSSAYRSGLRENDVIVFVGKTNVERMVHDDIKTIIRAMALTSDYIELIVLSKNDIPRYRILREKHLINWSVIRLE